MFKNIIIKSLVESLIGWVLLAVVVMLTKNVTFVQALTSMHCILMAVAGFVGCCIGFQRKAEKQSQVEA